VSEELVITPRTRVLALTGAGISAESGVPTYRGMGGLWRDHRFEDVASPEGFAKDPALVWSFYSERRAAAASVTPNAGHRALVDLERRLGDRFLLATQNVDALHTRAGSERVVELHGCLFRTRCSRCDRAPFADDAVYEPQKLPACARCADRGDFALLRPDIVWFGEALDARDLERIERFLASAKGEELVFLAVGTSGAVYPAAALVDVARRFGGASWLVNAERADNASRFDHVLEGKAGEILPELLHERA
jgi:NAD-dependent deacetylase